MFNASWSSVGAHMNLVSQVNSSLGRSRTDALQVTLQRRFAKGFNADPGWRESNDARPHRFVATGIYQFPFGRGRPYASSGPLSYLLGGFQVAATYEWSPGPLLHFGRITAQSGEHQAADSGAGAHSVLMS